MDASAPPLDGIRVLDLSQIYNGPYATYLMAMGGAEVVKVEPPGGEPLRRRAALGGAALPFAMLNGCKRSVVLDLKSETGVQALRRLAVWADVVVENFAPGVMDRLGVGAEVLMALNSRLIYASSSGYGRDGPYATYPAMDLTVQAMSGVMETTGFPDMPPVKAGPAIADFAAGTHLYGAIVTALFDRERTGRARRVEVSMQDAVYATLSSSLGMHWEQEGKRAVPPRTGNRHGGLAEAPYNVYRATDGYVAIICVGDEHWRRLTSVMGAPALAEDPRFRTLADRIANVDAVDAMVEAWTAARSRSELFAALMKERIPSAPVRTLEEVMNDPNMHQRRSLEWVDHPDYGRLVLFRSPLRFDGSPDVDLIPSRRLGADTIEVLGIGRPLSGGQE